MKKIIDSNSNSFLTKVEDVPELCPVDSSVRFLIKGAYVEVKFDGNSISIRGTSIYDEKMVVVPDSGNSFNLKFVPRKDLL